MSEYQLQLAVSQYLNIRYPNVIYRSDLAGVRLHQGLRAKIKAIQKPYIKYPDMFLAWPMSPYAGLYLELKTGHGEIYTLKGELRSGSHVREQYETMMRLRSVGYAATFACGIDESMYIIDEYLSGQYIEYDMLSRPLYHAV